jgi:hypothetical protein
VSIANRPLSKNSEQRAIKPPEDQEETMHRDQGKSFRAPAVVATLAATAFLALGAAPVAAAEPACGAGDGTVGAICGVTDVEDLIALTGTRWIVGSALPGPDVPVPALYLFDSKSRAVTPVKAADIAVKQDKKAYPQCSAAPNFAGFASHGLDYRARRGGGGDLYVVNHGGREAVEVFDVDTKADVPKLTWIGCVPAPDHFWPDAVAALPDGGMVVTSLWDPQDAGRVDKLAASKPVGSLGEWHADKGWKMIGPADMSGPNGVIASPNGRMVYVALWTGRKVLRIDRKTGKTKDVAVDYLADNLRWDVPGRSFFLGGQAVTVGEALTCFASKDKNCNVPTSLDRIDAKSLTRQTIVAKGTLGGMGAGTGAIRVGDELWVTTFRADRIARIAAPH